MTDTQKHLKVTHGLCRICGHHGDDCTGMERPAEFVLSEVPNNKRGRALVELLHEHLNTRRFKMRVRGNGPRSAPAKADGVSPARYHQDLPIKHAKTLRVYLDDKVRPLEQRAAYYASSTTQELLDVRDQLAAAHAKAEAAIRERDDALRAASVAQTMRRDLAEDAERAVMAAEANQTEALASKQRMRTELAATVRILLEKLAFDEPAAIVARAVLEKHGA